MKLTTKTKLTAITTASLAALVALVLPTSTVGAQSAIQNGINASQGEGVPNQLFGDGSIFNNVVNVMLFIIGAVSVVMLIWGGIRYTTSAGNAASVTAAKSTIMYAIIGLVIAFLAFAIVNWVLGAVSPQ